MTKKDIERIIKQGSVRQQIKLYMSDIASYNLAFQSLLTDKERDLIWNNIKSDKDIKYYEELRKWNQLFLMYKPHVELLSSRLRADYNVLISVVIRAFRIGDFIEVINPTLYSIKDLKTREKVLKALIKNSKDVGGVIDQEGEGIEGAWFNLNYNQEKEDIIEFSRRVNNDVKECKTSIIMVSNMLKNLPVKPYKDWIKLKENEIKELIVDGNKSLNGINQRTKHGENILIDYEEVRTPTEEEIENNLKLRVENEK